MDLTVRWGVKASLLFILFIFESIRVLLRFKSSSSGFEEGDVFPIETSWRHWTDDAETLLWMDSDVR